MGLLKDMWIAYEEDFKRFTIRYTEDFFVMSFESFNQAKKYLLEHGKEEYLNKNVTQVRFYNDSVEFSI